MITVELTNHKTNGLIIADFQYENKIATAVLLMRKVIIFGKEIPLEISYAVGSESPSFMDVLTAIADYVQDDVQCDWGGKILTVWRHGAVSRR